MSFNNVSSIPNIQIRLRLIIPIVAIALFFYATTLVTHADDDGAAPIVIRHQSDTTAEAPKKDVGEWIQLFKGQNLDGWVQRNGWATYRIADDSIEGKTSEGSPNSFLCTAEEYGDFEFSVEVKCDPSLNSGIQIRSRSTQEYDHGRVHGPQVEIAPNNAGYIYGEATGRNWLSPTQEPHQHFDPSGWNHYLIRAQGKRMQSWVNGHLIEDITDPLAPEYGFIGLQVHGINAGSGPFQVQWRNICVRKL